MRYKYFIVALGLITILAAFPRLYHLSSVAPSPYLDEVSNGYNAYAIFKTGSDEYGKHFPLLLQAYNDFRPALFVYLTVPFVALFGLSTFAIRLPAVLLHILATVALFFLTKELLREPHAVIASQSRPVSVKHHGNAAAISRLVRNDVVYISLLTSFLYAISPWSIYSSRMSDEINMSLCVFIFAATFFMYAMNRMFPSGIMKNDGEKAWQSIAAFFVSVVLFIIAFYAYHGIKLFVPFFILGACVLYFKEFLQRKKIMIVGALLGVILLIPLFLAFLVPGATVRLGAVNNAHPELVSLSAQRILYDKTHHDIIGEVFDNRRLLFSLEFLKNYLRNFDPTWLFLQQGNRTYMVPDHGPFYLFELPLLLMGIYFLITQPVISKKVKILMLIWILASAIPAAVSSESPHLNRTNTMLPACTILEAMGLYLLFVWVSRLHRWYLKYSGYAAVFIVIFVSFIWFLHAYFIEFPYVHAKEFQYGAVQAFEYAKQHENQYQKIIVSNKDTFLEGYMYYLFATKYDPLQYQKNGGTHSAFFTDTHLIGKYDFRDPNLYEPKSTGVRQNILYITNPTELSPQIMKNENVSVIQKYQYPDGSDAVWILAGKI